tara:strand:- start:860 stop:1324 length:465 start_codon:yes stop_codon:yes gene_type:complete
MEPLGPAREVSQTIPILQGTIIDWNWIRDYGLIRLDKSKKEYFVHYSNVKIIAKDESGKPIVLKTNGNGFPVTNKENDSFVRADEGEKGLQIYGREAAKGFYDAQENEIEMKKHQVWFDIGEEVYFTTSIDSPNMALNVTLSRDDTSSALAVSI